MTGRDAAAALRQRLAALPARLRAEAANALQGAGDDTVTEARRLLGGGASGPARPGDPPRDPTGHLAASLTATLDPDGGQARVTATSPQAAFLEYGTRTMAARPFLRPAAEAVRPAALAACRAAMARAAGDGGRGT